MAIAHVNGVDAASAVLEQAVGEAAGGGPHVGSHRAGHAQSEAHQRRLQFFPAPAHEARTGLQRDFDVRRHPGAGLVGHLSHHAHQASADQPLGLRPGLRQPPLDQQNIQPLLRPLLFHPTLDFGLHSTSIPQKRYKGKRLPKSGISGIIQ